MALGIPEQHHEIATKLFDLPTLERSKLLDVVSAFTPATNVFHYELDLEEALPEFSDTFPPNWSEKLVQFFFSIYNLNEVQGEHRDVATELATTLREIKAESDTEVAIEKVGEFADFLRNIMNFHSSLGISAKAVRLSLQHDRMYVGAEIFSDIRSIFQKDPAKIPEGAVIIHKLKMHTHVSNGNAYEDVFAAMDYFDLLQLKDTVERAITKHHSLSRMLDKLDLKHVSLWDDNE